MSEAENFDILCAPRPPRAAVWKRPTNHLSVYSDGTSQLSKPWQQENAYVSRPPRNILQNDRYSPNQFNRAQTTIYNDGFQQPKWKAILE